MRDFVSSDLPTINSWHIARGQTGMTSAMVPVHGAIEPGVAAGFLYCTDAFGIAYMDLYVTNPEAPLRARHRAVEDITNWLTDRAERCGIKHVFALTHVRSMRRIADRLGFRDGGLYRAMVKEVG